MVVENGVLVEANAKEDSARILGAPAAAAFVVDRRDHNKDMVAASWTRKKPLQSREKQRARFPFLFCLLFFLLRSSLVEDCGKSFSFSGNNSIRRAKKKVVVTTATVMGMIEMIVIRLLIQSPSLRSLLLSQRYGILWICVHGELWVWKLNGTSF